MDATKRKRYLEDESIAIPRQTTRWREEASMRKQSPQISPLPSYPEDEDIFWHNQSDTQDEPFQIQMVAEGNQEDIITGLENPYASDSFEEEQLQLTDDERNSLLFEDENEDDEESSTEETEESDDDGDNHTEDRGFLLNDPDKKVSSEGSMLSRAESLLAVLALSVRHNLTGKALQDIVQLINLHCPCTLPKSKYLFNNVLTNYMGICEYHFYCPSCKGYLGVGDNVADACVPCDLPFVKERSLQNGQFFIVMPIQNQLKHLLENTCTGNLILNREIKTNAGNEDICDIRDGKMYQNLLKEGLLSAKGNFSLTWNSDGVPIFKSSKFSIWPVLCAINELPVDERKKHVFLTTLWFGNDRPHPQTFLKPFVHECNILSTNGFSWQHGSDRVISKVFPIVCCADSPARCMLQNMTQFNGYYGCGFCMHEGEYDRDSNSMKFRYSEPLPELRTCEKTKEDSIIATETGNRVNGVRGVSVLSFLLYFDIIFGFIPDYMHAVCLGTVRRFFLMWIDSKNCNEPFYIGLKKKIISQRITNIKPIKELTRIPRSLDDIKYWKASEWRSFLFYSPVILTGILPTKYLAHWAMLVQAIFCLSSTSISQESLKLSEFLIRKFLMYVEPLYGQREMTYNVHLLLHMTNSVSNWGPLWGTSAFVFESYNGHLKNLVNGTRYVPQQIFNALCRMHDIHKNFFYISSSNAEQYVKSLLNPLSLIYQPFTATSNGVKVVGLGQAVLLPLTASYRLALQSLLGESVLVDSVTCHKRFTVNGVLLSSMFYSRKFKRTDSLIDLGNGVAEILYLVTFKNHVCMQECLCQAHIVLLLQHLSVVKSMKYTCSGSSQIGCTVPFIKEVEQGTCFAVLPNVPFHKAFHVTSNGKRYTITLPNRFEE